MAAIEGVIAPKRVVSLGATKNRYGEKLVLAVLFGCAALSVGTTVAIVVSLLRPTVEFFDEVGVVEFLTGRVWSPLFANPSFGVLPLISATLLITAIALAVALPVGLAAAIYLSEYARPRVRRVLKPTLEVLAGIPTVVYGFFALTFVTPLLQDIWLVGDPPAIFNAMSAGLVMGMMIVPTVASVSEDAMSAVPQALRNGAAALGSTRLQISTRVVVPAALSGIVAAFVLGFSRAIGETMIVLIAAGITPTLSVDPAKAMQTMTAFIGQAGLGDQSTGSTGYKTIFAVGSLLFLATFLVNMVSIRLVRRFREVYE
ncbi:MAG TPA: phosphate ABC transporter permease subunit PstC [Acidimicrobiales bacterium]|nr:phosphate ABC transporter permease subunit PstC [Acidimicrobiales bacterium]